MAIQLSYVDLLKLLPNTNCRECGAPTCMVFAVEAAQGKRELSSCPYLGEEVTQKYQAAPSSQDNIEKEQARMMEELKSAAAKVNLKEAAGRLRARYKDGRLAVPMLGKEFFVDSKGGVVSQCHTNNWLRVPLLSYVAHCRGVEARGKWVPLRDLPQASEWSRLFNQRCEKPFLQLIDRYTNLFEIIIEVFDGQRAEEFESDIAVILHPLPLLPMLICYWKPEDGMGSQLSLFFDSTAEENISPNALYTLGAGMVTMFEKIALTHGV